ncbi:hypothetical protein B0H14DRAFT_1496224 [Mycena olivaceomarginata]|nr:hypothetical protein B0H14DRAFT_1496224 [Mycena olivaceomarginata]
MDETNTIILLLSSCPGSKYMNVSSVAILVFDYALTFSLEVSLIWKSKWSLPKVLFILSRYSTIFDVPLVLYCKLDLSMEWRR